MALCGCCVASVQRRDGRMDGGDGRYGGVRWQRSRRGVAVGARATTAWPCSRNGRSGTRRVEKKAGWGDPCVEPQPAL